MQVVVTYKQLCLAASFGNKGKDKVDALREACHFHAGCCHHVCGYIIEGK